MTYLSTITAGLLAGCLLVAALAACDGAASKASGPSLNCTIYQNDSGDKAASAGVGDTTQTCTKSKDSHDDNSEAAAE